ncbi:MAG TPA: YtxH domain-containing protein [Chitinophagaceae bacterium]|nr:YtxH domain-containing protein [Chitinophagaceae bacterium]
MNKILIGFTAGLLVGLLFAPAKGSETRETITRRGRDLKNQFNDLVDAITDKFDSLTGEVESPSEFGRQREKAFNEVI